MTNVAGPLKDLRVICMAEQYPGPYATMVMADLGAEVVIVERPDGGDPARQFPAFHAALNRNKRSVTLDLKSDAGKQALTVLLDDADILLEGFRPGAMERLGFGYERVHERFPRLIYVSISGFGQFGPYRDRAAHDLSYQAVAGMLFTQARTGVATPVGDVAVGDLSSAMFALTGSLAALHERQSTGRGRHVDVSMADGLLSWMSVQMGPQLNGRAPADLAAEPAYGVFTCRDGALLTLSIAHEDKFWRVLCQLLDLPDAAALEHAARIGQTVALRQRISRALIKAPRAVWAEQLEAAGIPWGPVNDLDEVSRDPHFVARGMFRTVTDADGSQTICVAQPLRFDRLHPGPGRGVPMLGEANPQLVVSTSAKEQ